MESDVELGVGAADVLSTRMGCAMSKDFRGGFPGPPRKTLL